MLHFVILGAALFGVHGFLSSRAASAPGQIVVTQGLIASLAVGFGRTWQRPPTSQELDGLIRDWIREEVYCREAMALGLDRDDTVIRRRLRQKMEFLSDDIATRPDATDADLAAYLRAHADTFRVEPAFTFRHVYLNPDKRGDRLARDAERLLAQLRRPGAVVDASALGDSSLLEPQLTATPRSEITTQFGEAFAATLAELAVGQWSGPIESGYGVHLVFVSNRTESHLPPLGDVRDAVRREWENAQRIAANENAYQTLQNRYTVIVERAEEAGAPAIPATP